LYSLRTTKKERPDELSFYLRLFLVKSMEIKVKTTPKHYEAGKQLTIQWDVTWDIAEKTKSSFLYLRENGRDMEIANNYIKLTNEGERLLKGRAKVSMNISQVVVTIFKLEYSDTFQFTVEASGAPVNKRLTQKNRTFTIDKVKGNLL